MTGRQEGVEVSATVEVDDGSWRGPVLAAGYQHLTVDVPLDAELVHLPLGTLAVLELDSPELSTTLREPAELVGVSWRSRVARCRFFLEHWDLMTTKLPRLKRPEREERGSLRVRTENEDSEEVPVRLLSGPASARRLRAEIRDLGQGGAGLWFPRSAEARLCTEVQFLATLPFDGLDREREWRCQVRNRRLDRAGVRYGVRFLTEGGGPDSGPRFEPMWDCPFCGAERLLAETHLHCPDCGSSRGDTPTRLPDWDDLVTAASHRFTGSGVTCSLCGVSHAAIAMYCAHCGTKL